ncbi:FKBP-type peptidyl-prolyl cis-trans isomerase [Larkinella sp. VNQ87]|uniref:FKBP-type peptidyl-prolyl cis-trans isomerase n=1 Tax=Larkinella sp. VNQ87 TaxID=3400921 RepID=UPI003C056F08
MKFKPFNVFIAFLLVIGLTSCMNNFNDESAGMAEKNDQEIRNYLNANQLQSQVTKTASGLYHIITPANSSAKAATANEELEFTYTLSYIAGSTTVLVDSANKTKSAYIPFLAGVVVQGLEEGFLLMREGQSARFFMPSNIAFGNDTRSGKMPAYSAVVFDVTLKRSRTQLEQMDDYAAIKKLGAPTSTTLVPNSTDSVRVYITSKGTGARVTTNQTVTVAYTANTFRASTPFDKGDSLSFKTSSNQVISGFDAGIQQLSVGDKAVLVFPSGVGYGAQGSYDQSKGYYIVPPYTPLAFEVTVKSAK